MKNWPVVLLGFLGGLLLFAAWPMSPFTFLIFVALVPLFWLEAITETTARFFWLLWLNLLVWNIATTWWIWNASPEGAIGAIFANSLLMCFPWMLYRYSRKKIGTLPALLAFACYWITWEYIHHNWELSWPWLTLGNVFATHPNWVQWYEWTGTTGGTAWILLVNMLIFAALKPELFSTGNATKNSWRRLIAPLLSIAIPMLCSYLFFNEQASYTNLQQPQENVVVVQPNVEAYTEKFNTNPALLIEKMIRLSESQLDSNTRLVVWPETAIPVQVWESDISTESYYTAVFNFTKRHPAVQLVTGIDSYKNWGHAEKTGFSIRKMRNGDEYEAFNTAMATDSTGNFELYHKSKLVPGVESLPSWLGFMGSVFDDLGGITGSLGRSDSTVVFSFPRNPYQPAPVICYESIYSEYVSEYVKRGANLVTVITNDGWWGETPGYKQHMNMARLRAIENRRWVARSANTGISCFIDPQGNVLEPQPWNKAAAIKMKVAPLNDLTFYTRHGDWLSRIIWPLAILFLIFVLFRALAGKMHRKA